MIKNKLLLIFNTIPLAPIFFASAFILSLFFQNIGEVTYNKLILPLLVTIFLTMSLSYFLRWFLKSCSKGDIYTSVSIILFFSYSGVISIANNFFLFKNHIDFGKNYLLIVIWLGFLIGTFIFIRQAKKGFLKLSRLLKIIGLIVVLMFGIQIIHYQLMQEIHPPASSDLKLPILKTIDTPPDIYYIIPDSYTSSGNLSTYFSYDNSAFITYLKNKGFYVAENSTSNYPTTLLSLSSSLNMEYLDYLSVFKNSSNQSLADPLIKNNNVLKLLRTKGYRYYQVGSWWRSTQSNPLADENFTIQRDNRLEIDDFVYTILKSSMVDPLLDKYMPEKIVGESEKDKRAIILYQFSTIPEVAKLPGPKFIFIHIIAPHAPYVFNKDCRFTSYANNWNRPEEQNFIDQVNCINQKLENSIETILKESSQPPVILLQADEGTKFIADKLKPKEAWKNASQELLKMKFPILSAYYLPGVSKKRLYPSITPVNSFRMIFNLYFSADMPLLPDKNYIYLDNKHLYDFKEVTNEVKN